MDHFPKGCGVICYDRTELLLLPNATVYVPGGRIELVLPLMTLGFEQEVLYMSR
jgi:hypothetical protein